MPKNKIKRKIKVKQLAQFKKIIMNIIKYHSQQKYTIKTQM